MMARLEIVFSVCVCVCVLCFSSLRLLLLIVTLVPGLVLHPNGVDLRLGVLGQPVGKGRNATVQVLKTHKCCVLENTKKHKGCMLKTHTRHRNGKNKNT